MLNAALAGNKKAFQQKLAMAKAVKARDYPMVLNFVLHRHNIDQLDKIIELCIELEAMTLSWPPASSTVGVS